VYDVDEEVDDADVEEHGGEEAPGLVPLEDRQRPLGPERLQRLRRRPELPGTPPPNVGHATIRHDT
jgi:hypothetical protein